MQIELFAVFVKKKTINKKPIFVNNAKITSFAPNFSQGTTLYTHPTITLLNIQKTSLSKPDKCFIIWKKLVKIVKNKSNCTMKKMISNVISVNNYPRDAIKSAQHANYREKSIAFAQSVQSPLNLSIFQIIFLNLEQAKCNPNYQNSLPGLLQTQVLVQTSKKSKKMKVPVHRESIDN